MSSPREVIAGRFEVVGDPHLFHRARGWLRKPWFYEGRGEKLDEENFWLRGIDRTTGAPVLIEPRRTILDWIEDVDDESRARRFMAMAPAFAGALHAGPGIVYADTPGLPRGTFTCAEAAELAVQACEATAALHAIGTRPERFDPRNLRIVEGPPRRIEWLVPGVPEAPGSEYRPTLFGVAFSTVYKALTEVQCAVWHLAVFFTTLLEPTALRDNASLAAFARMAKAPAELVPTSIAELARLLLPLTRSPDVAARVAALPTITTLPSPWPDWDDQIHEGEALLRDTDEHDREYVTLPLAAAYHERASRAFAAGDMVAALADVERAIALDGVFLPYQTTRAVVLDAIGRGAEALPTLREAIASAPLDGGRRRFIERDDAPSEAERARAHAVRGMIALRVGDPGEAERALLQAMEIHRTGLYAHILGAARWALGDFQGAAEAEMDSVSMEPRSTRYRWALIASLRKLGRNDQARKEAQVILEQEPDVPAHRERFERLFGG